MLEVKVLSDTEKLEYENRVRERIIILEEWLKKGKIVIADHLAKDFEESLRNVKYDQDGNIDLKTVDGRIRSMALTVGQCQREEDVKSQISLYEIQRHYFEIFEKNFGKMYEDMKKNNGNPHLVARWISESDDVQEFSDRTLPQLLDMLYKFWEYFEEANLYHIQDLVSLKGSYAGDLFPSYMSNIASKCGIYLDTIVVPDPYIRMGNFWKLLQTKQKVYYLIKHALNILNYKEIAFAELKTPIIVVAPEIDFLEEDRLGFQNENVLKNTQKHIQGVFGEIFSDIEEAKGFCKELKDVEAIITKISCHERVLFDTDWTEPLSKQLIKAFQEYPQSIREKESIGELYWRSVFGRMKQAEDALFYSRAHGGIPVIEAPTSWRYFNWKLEYDTQESIKSDVNTHSLAGLQLLAEENMCWLGKVPIDTLIELRKQDALPELREMFSKGLPELIQADAGNFKATGEKVLDNIRRSFNNHEKIIEDFERQKGKIGKEVLTKSLVYGGIGLAASWLLPGALSALHGAIGWPNIPSLKDAKSDWDRIPEKFNEVDEKQKEEKKTPVGLLFCVANE